MCLFQAVPLTLVATHQNFWLLQMQITHWRPLPLGLPTSKQCPSTWLVAFWLTIKSEWNSYSSIVGQVWCVVVQPWTMCPYSIYTQQKKFLDTYKSSIFTKMLHIRQIKSLFMWSRWMSSSFWYQTWRNRLINNWVLIIWMETGTFSKVANESIQLYRDEQICVLMNSNICNFSKRTWMHSNG